MKLPANAGGTRDTGLIPGLGRSPGGGQLAPVFLPEESPGQRSLEGYSPRGHQESDTTERLSTHTGISMSETNWVVYIWTSIPHEGRSTDMNFQGSYFFPSLSSGWQMDFLMTYWAIYFFSLYFSWDWGPSRVLHGGLSCGALVAHGFRTLTSAPTLPSPAPPARRATMVGPPLLPLLRFSSVCPCPLQPSLAFLWLRAGATQSARVCGWHWTQYLPLSFSTHLTASVSDDLYDEPERHPKSWQRHWPEQSPSEPGGTFPPGQKGRVGGESGYWLSKRSWSRVPTLWRASPINN